jgi:hypothetical protein
MDYAKVVQGLLAKAERTDNPEEAAAYFAKAEELMQKYRLEQADLLAMDPASAVPVEREIVLHTGYTLLTGNYIGAFREVARHAGVRYVTTGLGDGSWGTKAIMIGWDGDVRYAEYLWTAVLLQFVTQIEPVWSDTETEATNIFRLRHSGLERKHIADRAWGPGSGKIAANRSKVQRIYIRECERRGVTPAATGLGFQADVYREAYARGFVQTLADRLSAARDAAGTHRGLPALHGRAEALNEAFYTRFPRMRPQPIDTNAPVAEYKPCERCEKNPSGTCRTHPYKSDTVAWRQRMERKYNSPSAYAGHDQGARAAADVDLARGGVDRQDTMGANDRAQLGA